MTPEQQLIEDQQKKLDKQQDHIGKLMDFLNMVLKKYDEQADEIRELRAILGNKKEQPKVSLSDIISNIDEEVAKLKKFTEERG